MDTDVKDSVSNPETNAVLENTPPSLMVQYCRKNTVSFTCNAASRMFSSSQRDFFLRKSQFTVTNRFAKEENVEKITNSDT